MRLPMRLPLRLPTDRQPTDTVKVTNHLDGFFVRRPSRLFYKLPCKIDEMVSHGRAFSFIVSPKSQNLALMKQRTEQPEPQGPFGSAGP